jgi:hypothetical protein
MLPLLFPRGLTPVPPLPYGELPFMRCALHPDRVAVQPCTICGRYHCDDCLAAAAGERACPACLDAARSGLDAPSAGSRPSGRPWPLIGGVAAASLVALLVTLAVLPRGGHEDALPVPGTEEREQITRACFAALERAAIAVETYRAEQGRWPRDWEALVPDLMPSAPIDPWNPAEEPLRLGTPDWDPDAIVLYSLGPDRRDDGGQAWSVETDRGDLVYRVR